MSADNHASLSTFMYSDSKAEEAVQHGLMQYLQHDHEYGSEPAGDITNQQEARPDSDGPLPPLPGHPGRLDRNAHTHLATDHDQNRAASQQYQDASPAPAPRAISPPDPTIPIPDALTKLAARALSSLDLPNPDSLRGENDENVQFLDYGERGEMGGKRRKLPHERAGWKEMEQQSQQGGVKRRRTKKSDVGVASPSAAGHGSSQPLITASGPDMASIASVGLTVSAANEAEMGQLAELSRMALLGSASAGQVPGETLDPTLTGATRSPHDGEQDQAQDGVNRDEPEIKLSRAEQNKRAQQAFRRRREEHMKKLELDSAQLASVRKQMEVKDALLRDAILTIESSKVEIAALQSALRAIAPHSAVSLLTDQGYLNVDQGVPVNRDSNVHGDESLQAALELLSRQAKEAAKLVHFRKE